MAGEQPHEKSSMAGAFPETPMEDNQTFSVNPIPASEGAGNPIQLAAGEKVPEPSSINDNTVSSQVHDDPELKSSAEGSEQTFGVAPIPASEGAGNPIQLAAGEKVPESSTINDNTVSSQVHDDPELKSSAEDSEQTFGVAPIPATGGIGNPVQLEPGEKVPDPSTFTGNTINSNVKLDKESYEKSDSGAPVLPPPLSPQSELEAGGASIFGLGPQTSNMIPESSMPIGKDMPADIGAQDTGPAISSVAPTSTTNELAGQQPIESREPPAIVTDSQQQAQVDPEAAASPRALQEKDEMESELHSKVPEAPATSESPIATKNGKDMAGMAAGGLAAAGAAAAGTAYAMRDKVTESTGKGPVSYLPQSVQDSIMNMNQKTAHNEPITQDPVAPAANEEGLPQQTAVGEGISVPGEADHAQDTTSQVPEEVIASQKEAHMDPEASASPNAVQEKSAMESELMSKVPESKSALPGLDTGTTETTAGMSSELPSAGTTEAMAAMSPTSPTSHVPEEVIASQQEARADPEASASPRAVSEKNEMESELMSKVPTSEATGEPAPTTSAALSETAPLASSEKATSAAPQLADPVGGVAPLSMEDKPVEGSQELNAPAGEPAVPPTQTAGALGTKSPMDSRDVSPMSKPVTNTQDQPTVTTGVESSKAPAESTPAAPAAGKPVGTPRRPGGENSTPQKRQSFIDRMKGTPDSQKSSGSGASGADGKEKRKSFFGRIKEKLK